jgi:hypothetical protein
MKKILDNVFTNVLGCFQQMKQAATNLPDRDRTEGKSGKGKAMNQNQNKPDLAAICIAAFLFTCAGCMVFGIAMLIMGKI